MKLQKKSILKIITRACILILAPWNFFVSFKMIFRVPTYCQSKLLTYFTALAFFYTPWKHSKTKDFLMFPGAIERDSGIKWVQTIAVC